MTDLQPYQPTAELAVVDMQDKAVRRLTEWAQSAAAAHNIATTLVQTTFVPDSFRGKPGEATAAILAGLEVGLQPMAALRSFDVIQGQAAPRAITLRAIVQSFGHEMVLEESTATRCRMRGKRRGTSDWVPVTWTIDRAKDLGLTSKHNWKAQPQAMLVARATSELARLIAADAILGLGYSAEEVADGGTQEQEVQAQTVDATPTGSRRMSRPVRPAPEPVANDEPADAEVEDQDAPMTERTRGAMFALLGEAGITDADAQRRFLGDTLGFPVSSRADLTEGEGLKAEKRLRAWKSGDDAAVWIDALKADATEAGEQ